VSAWPPYYLSVDQFSEVMDSRNHDASVEGPPRTVKKSTKPKLQLQQSEIDEAIESSILFVSSQNYYTSMISAVFECIFGSCVNEMEVN
jgi:hypothetical protein